MSTTVFAQADANAASLPNPPVAQMIREKYQSIQIETFQVKPGVEFPPEYLPKAQGEMFKQLSDGKIVKEVLRSGCVRRGEGVPIMFLSGTINNYTPGSRSKRYVGFGLGAAEVDAEIFLQSRIANQVHAERQGSSRIA